MTDPPVLSGEVSFGGTITHRFEDAQEYEAFVSAGRPAMASAHFECSYPALRDDQARRVVLWGARRRDVQLGSPEDRFQEMRRRGELKLVVPRVRYLAAAAAPDWPRSIEFKAVDEAYGALRRQADRPR